MKIKCKVCRKETEINELDYNPGDKVVMECQRCGNEMETIIPPREEEPAEKPKIRVVDNDLKSAWYGAANTTPSEAPKIEEKKQQEPKPIPAPPAAQTIVTAQNQQRPAGAPPPPPPVNVYTPADPSGSNRKTIIFVILGVLVVAGIVIWLIAGISGGREASAVDSLYAVEQAVEAVEPAEAIGGTDYNTSDYYDEIDTVVALAAEAPAVTEEVARAFIPVISSTTSSEAYDVYAPYVTDNKFGDAWATTDLVQNAIHGNLVDIFVKGEGDIEGYPLSIDAVILKDGRIYGRYLNEYNGVKLDINGGFDINNDLIIKLGHKSETSYWALKNEGVGDDGLLHFRGTWGKSNKSTSLRLRATDQR